VEQCRTFTRSIDESDEKSDGRHWKYVSTEECSHSWSSVSNAFAIEYRRVINTHYRFREDQFVAFRGFGGPQAMFVTETMIEHVAQHLGGSFVK
jgi:xanthine dehydrogenase molybdopterin-binding subunit B